MGLSQARVQRRRVKPADERRRDLLDAGLGVLIDRGYEHATVDDITAAAGVAKGTFYLYFESKADLVLALRQQVWEQIAADVAMATASQQTDWWAVFDTWIEAFVGFLVENRQAHDALWHGTAGTRVSEDPDAMEVIAQAISQGVAAGAFSVEDPLLAAAMLFYGVHGTVETALAQGRVSRARLRQVTRSLARRLLEADTSS
jgi:AcrR family transcriptional regulator